MERTLEPLSLADDDDHLRRREGRVPNDAYERRFKRLLVMPRSAEQRGGAVDPLDSTLDWELRFEAVCKVLQTNINLYWNIRVRDPATRDHLMNLLQFEAVSLEDALKQELLISRGKEDVMS